MWKIENRLNARAVWLCAFNSAQSLRPLRLCGLDVSRLLFTAEAQRTQRLRGEHRRYRHAPDRLGRC
jgi:hypothetical protein